MAGIIPAGNEHTVFSGLSLGPGNYYLTFQSTNGGALGWIGFGGPPISTSLGTGVAYLGGNGLNLSGFAPAGTSSTTDRTLAFLVTGDLQDSRVPEPSTLALTLAAAALLHLKRRG